MGALAYGAAAIAAALVVLYALPYAVKMLQRRRLRTLCRAQRCIVFTYDDGPSSDITPPLLDLLAKHGAQATFFLRGDHAVDNPRVVDRIVTEGHEVGCHSARHYHPWTSMPWKLSRDMLEGYRLLAPWIRADAPYRPPFGKPFLPVFVRLALRRAKLAWWTVDTRDTYAARQPIDETVAVLRAAGGGVVLMHDRRDGNEGQLDYVLEATERLLRMAREEGFGVKRLCELY
jgi:peptidoglycan-N-acetylglucosamine deacetylase